MKVDYYPMIGDPNRGKARLRQLIREFLQRSSGPVTVSGLLGYLSSQGFYVAETRRVLGQFVDVDDEGHVAMREET